VKLLNIINKTIREKNFLSLSGNLSVAAFRFVSFMILARYLDKDNFGQWMLFLTANGLLEMIRSGVTKVAMIRFLSGATDDERKVLVGTNWVIGLILTSVLSAVVFFTNLFFPEAIDRSGYYYFFAWYPLLGFFNLPYINSLVILNSQQRFGSILFLNILQNSIFLFFLFLNSLVFKYGVSVIIVVYIFTYLITSFVSIFLGYDGLRHIFKSSTKVAKKILNFGKFTLGTLIGTNLLKNADTIIIGLSPLGTEAVALYSIPLKLTELLELPLRSFVATAFPRLSRASIHGKVDEVKSLFYTYSGAITLLFIPMVAICMILAPYLIQILGGAKYLETNETVILFQVFAIYALFTPIDRISGVTLDSINRPRNNFYKIIVMATLNIIGDLVAVYVFESLILVAVVTIIFTIIGLIIGYKFVDHHLNLKFINIFKAGFDFYTKGYNKLIKGNH